MGSTPTFNIKALRLFTNVQLLNTFYSEWLIQPCLSLFNRFPVIWCTTKATLIIIDLVCYISWLKMTRTCSTSHTGSIHVNTLGADTHIYITHIVDKSNFKKPVEYQPFVPDLKGSLYQSTSCLKYNNWIYDGVYNWAGDINVPDVRQCKQIVNIFIDSKQLRLLLHLQIITLCHIKSPDKFAIILSVMTNVRYNKKLYCIFKGGRLISLYPLIPEIFTRRGDHLLWRSMICYYYSLSYKNNIWNNFSMVATILYHDKYKTIFFLFLKNTTAQVFLLLAQHTHKKMKIFLVKFI